MIDASVSVALSPTTGDVFDEISSLAVVCTVLARTGQFARLRGLAPRFRRHTDLLRETEPFLAVSINALSFILEGYEDRARSLLNVNLGLEESSRFAVRAPRTSLHLIHALLATALHEWLMSRSSELLPQVRAFALEVNDGFLVTIANLASACVDAIEKSAVDTTLARHLPNVDQQELSQYLAARNVRTLFPAQLFALENGVLDAANSVVAMPTSSGKTLLAEFCIFAVLGGRSSKRAIYLAPYRLLSRQVEVALRGGLRQLGITVQDLGSAFDTSVGDDLLVDGLPDVAIMTPERFDALFRLSDTNRKGSDAARELVNSIELIVFDEVQLVGRESRGPRLELLLARIKQRLPNVRILALAALLKGIESLANWLDAKPIVYGGARPTGILEVMWNSDGELVQRFESGRSKIGDLPPVKQAIDGAARLVLRLREELFPILVVETQRQYAESVVRRVAELAPHEGARWLDKLRPEQRRFVDGVAGLAAAALGDDNDLSRLIRQGLAYHHAGVPPHLLRAIEGLVRSRSLRALGSTTTVAEGAHLPVQAVIIPHLSFPGGSRLSRDLYQNIVGRAGRAHEAIEGLVFVLESETMSGYVQRILWNDAIDTGIQSRLPRAFLPPQSLDAHKTQREVRNQVLAWIGDEGSYVENQAEVLSGKTLAWESPNGRQRQAVATGLAQLMTELEAQNALVAASPYRLTSIGRRMRLAGISPDSCLRIYRALEDASLDAFIQLFSQSEVITRDLADVISRIVFESEEVIEASLWFRRLGLRPEQQPDALRALMRGTRPWPSGDEVFEADLRLLSGWILGRSYRELGKIPPVFGGRAAFSGNDPAERASDAAEQIGRIAHSAGWAWGAVRALLGEDGDQLPGWIRTAVELGVPTETAAELIRTYDVSREAAVRLAEQMSPRWSDAANEVLELSPSDPRVSGLREADLMNLFPFSSTLDRT